jgi:hypothetical protein
MPGEFLVQFRAWVIQWWEKKIRGFRWLSGVVLVHCHPVRLLIKTNPKITPLMGLLQKEQDSGAMYRTCIARIYNMQGTSTKIVVASVYERLRTDQETKRKQLIKVEGPCSIPGLLGHELYESFFFYCLAYILFHGGRKANKQEIPVGGACALCGSVYSRHDLISTWFPSDANQLVFLPELR